MLLSALRDYAKTNKELPDFYGLQEVRYAIHLGAAGGFVSIDRLTDAADPKRGKKLSIPYIKRGSSVVPLPVDRGDYLLGVVPEGKTDQEHQKAKARTPRLHRAYISLLDEAASQTGLPSFQALHRFASTVDPDELALPEGFDARSFVAVYVDGLLPTDDPVAKQWWAKRCQQDERPPSTVCGVCGSRCAPVEYVPVEIRGLTRIGGKANMALISANEDVFERHGMTRATGASVCLSCGKDTHQVLNQLIADDHHSTKLGDSLFVWWTTEPVDDLLAAIISGESDQDVVTVLHSLASGQLQPAVDASRFFGVSLGASSARVVVRSWTDITLAAAFRSIQRWFGRIRMVDRDGRAFRYSGIYGLLASVAPPGQDSPLSRLAPGLVDSVLTAALTSARLPPSLLAHTLGRLRAEQGTVSPASAALLKACLTPVDHANPEDHMTALDDTSPDPAYRCGRLLALLDDAARLATTRNNALVDRSYSAASTMPAITFTRLLRLHRAHIDKLRRDHPGAATRIDADVTEIIGGLGGLTDLPGTLSVNEQARFALGLYHQKAAGRAAVQQAKEAKALG